MGRGNSERQTAQTNYSRSLNNAYQESPYEKRRREWNEGILNWADSGDYSQPPPGAKIFFNFADPAERRRRSEVLANTRGQGVSALGAGANPTLLALDKEHRDAEFERDSAANYQETARQLVGGALSETADLQNLDQSKRLNILGATGGVYSSALSKPKQPAWWERMIGGGAQAADSAQRRGASWLLEATARGTRSLTGALRVLPDAGRRKRPRALRTGLWRMP